MLGSLLTRVLLIVLGYVYPAYECYKTVEKHDLSIDQLKFWCQYWILVAVLTLFERVGDYIISWLPLYGEAKIALVLYLWHPKTRGTVYIYGSFLKLYLVKHEKEIDLKLQKMRNKAGIITTLVMQKVLSYGQSRFFEVLQYVSSQSNQEFSEKGK
ncbi:hypothetical protein RD792_016374 [Penstemon davidsonii]|uniref:HVA22-like protein n=1 Tax=Penstemon davidsonii TaxID=160366 RepID=A0ABR0CKV8_9LAMI|nr:hypothetical protein RD792_016374 [Penstemon davidsonii]